MFKRPTYADLLIAAVFIAVITFQPYFLHGKINLFELGIYLPNIDALFSGKVPYRDFFYLRGPFELYVPAGLMAVFGKEISVLMAYFYGGTVLTILLFAWIGKNLYRTRWIFFLMVAVLVARTFPRVVFTYWGGWRFALGALAILLAIPYFSRKRRGWLFAAGIITSCALLTSIEVGTCSFTGITAALVISALYQGKTTNKILLEPFLSYGAGCLPVVIPYAIYLAVHQAFLPYCDALYHVLTNMQNVFPSDVPRFQHMTPAFLYVVLVSYLIYKIWHRKMGATQFMVIALGVYGLVLYLSAFRNIEAAQFEMALQPEKILFFFLWEEAYLFLAAKKVKYIAILIVILTLSSLGYAAARYNNRFFVYKYLYNKLTGHEIAVLRPLAGEESVRLETQRVKGLVVPKEQAEDFIQLRNFVQERTAVQEPVFMFPELGIYYFIVDRPFAGRFATATFSWMDERWHEELMSWLKETPPRVAVVQREPSPWFAETYFEVSKNRDKYQQTLDFIQKHYILAGSTHSLDIYTYFGER